MRNFKITFQKEEYQKDVVLYCENLQELDGDTITAEMRFKFLNMSFNFIAKIIKKN